MSQFITPGSRVGGRNNTSASTVKTQTLIYATTVNWNVSNGAIATLTLTGNATMAAPGNLKVGSYILIVIQDGTGSRTITWNSIFKWPGRVAPTLSTTAGFIDIISLIYDGTNIYGTYMNNMG